MREFLGKSEGFRGPLTTSGSKFGEIRGETPMTETPESETGKARRGGQKGNRSSLRHGLFAGKLPLGCQHVENACNALRRQLEDAVVAIRGEVGLLDAANIQTAIKWERHGALALRWLRVS